MINRVVVINDVATARGGATGLALLSIRLLRQAGVPVTFFVGNDGENPELRELGVNIVALGGSHVAKGGRLNAVARGIYNVAARNLLAQWIEVNDRPGIVYHVHGWSKILSPAIFQALAPVARRTILHAHDFFLACPNGAFQDYQRSELCARVPLSLDCLATNCDKRSYADKLWRATRQETLSLILGRRFEETPVVMIHDLMADYLERSGFSRQRLQVLRNPVQPFTTTRIPAERNSVFYFVGRIEFEKGIKEAAEAAARAGVVLRIIGDGSDRAAFEAKHPNVEILGWSSRETIGTLVRDARALLMPSRYPEPFGLVAAEASRSGLPVILSKNAFLAQEFVDQGLGLACDTQNITEFAATLRRLSEMSADQISAMSERAFSAEVPIATTPSVWRDRLISLYRERIFEGQPSTHG